VTASASSAVADGPVLEARAITKIFGGTTALRGVDFALYAGQVHALIGENGAGKSTLVKILAGVEHPSGGQLFYGGAPVMVGSTRDAARLGIALIHQELQLFPDLSIAENLFAGRERVTRWGTVDRNTHRRRTRETLALLGQRFDPDTLVNALPLGAQQIVEIARALVHDTRVLLMDEPTSALSPSEVAVLFGIIRSLVARGVAIVYISHRLHELLSVADTVTVLRDGSLVGLAPARDVDVAWIVTRMTGRQASTQTAAGSPCQLGPEVLSVRGLSLPAAPGRVPLCGISFSVYAGEIVGIYGSMGAGRTEVLESVLGLHPDARGDIILDGTSVGAWPVARRLAAGLAIVPEDRQRSGLVQTLSVGANLTLSSLDRCRRAGVLSPALERQESARLADEVRLRAPSFGAPIGSLSGGNQQKVVIGRAMMRSPRVLLMDEPSRGVDVSARADIIECVRRLAAGGMAVAITSSDLDEVRAVSTRILVLSRGSVAAEYAAHEATDASIAAAASGGAQEN
jgi:erythritol transport system ATP-binding protein